MFIKKIIVVLVVAILRKNTQIDADVQYVGLRHRKGRRRQEGGKLAFQDIEILIPDESQQKSNL